MSFTKSDVSKRVSRLVKDVSGALDPETIDDCIGSAVDYHSRIRKNITVVSMLATGTVTASGDRTYPLPTGWDDGFSDFNFRIEYPVNSEDNWPTYLPRQMCEIWNAAAEQPGTTGEGTTLSGKRLRFRETLLSNRTPQKGDQFNVHFQVRYVVSDTASKTTVPDGDFWPIIYLAANQACIALATQFAQNTDSTLAADTANYRDKSQQFLAMAKSWMDKYKEAVIPQADQIRPFGEMGEFEQDDFSRTPYPFYWRDESDLKNVDR